MQALIKSDNTIAIKFAVNRSNKSLNDFLTAF